MKIIKKIYMSLGLIISTQLLFAEHKDIVYVFNNYGKDMYVQMQWGTKNGQIDFSSFTISKKDSFNDTLSDADFDKKFQHKAPISKYYLREISVIPQANTWGHTNFQVGANVIGSVPLVAVGLAAVTIDVALALSSAAAYVSEDEYGRSRRMYNHENNQGLATSGLISLGHAWDASLTKNQKKEYFDHEKNNKIFILIEDSGKKSKIKGQNKINVLMFLSKEACKKHIAEKEALLTKDPLEILKTDVDKLVELNS